MSVARQVGREAMLRVPPLPSRDLQELWFATRRREWRTLVVMPASAGTSALGIAKSLGEVGGFIRMSPVQVINAEGLDLGKIAALVMDISAAATSAAWTMNSPNTRSGGVDPGARLDATIVALDPVVANPLVLPVALAADAVLLCVELGTTELEAARRTLELVGRDRVIGSVVIKH
jgi:hypothetical protein